MAANNDAETTVRPADPQCFNCTRACEATMLPWKADAGIQKKSTIPSVHCHLWVLLPLPNVAPAIERLLIFCVVAGSKFRHQN
jgi:hypothetical protein